MRAQAEVQLASGTVGRVLRRAAVAGDTDLEAEADRAGMGDCVGVGRGGRHSEERVGEPLGTQCSQETAVPVVNPGSSPPINFLILECVASVLHCPLPRLCGDLLCVGTVQQEAQPASLRADTVLHCADEHPEVRRRGRSPPAAPQGWGCSSEGSACFSRQHSPQTGMGPAFLSQGSH